MDGSVAPFEQYENHVRSTPSWTGIGFERGSNFDARIHHLAIRTRFERDSIINTRLQPSSHCILNRLYSFMFVRMLEQLFVGMFVSRFEQYI
jgi:hypothetical protein